ncbi:MAG TPA: SIMPL domain-containing protein [Burkholderiaceae bacterium]
MKYRHACLPIILFLAIAAPVLAADAPPQRSVTVTGEAEVKVVPDEVVLSFGVESHDKSLVEVKRMNDTRVKNIVNGLLAQNVMNKDIKTDYINLQPEYQYSSSSFGRGVGTFIDYSERTAFVVTLRDITKYEAVITALLQAGTESISSVNFRTSETRKFKDEARTLAMKAAREKAEALAAVLGEQIGRVREIHEGQENTYGGFFQRNANAQVNAFQNSAGAGDASDSSLAPGTLSIRANVTVTFDLK